MHLSAPLRLGVSHIGLPLFAANLLQWAPDRMRILRIQRIQLQACGTPPLPAPRVERTSTRVIGAGSFDMTPCRLCRAKRPALAICPAAALARAQWQVLPLPDIGHNQHFVCRNLHLIVAFFSELSIRQEAIALLPLTCDCRSCGPALSQALVLKSSSHVGGMPGLS